MSNNKAERYDIPQFDPKTAKQDCVWLLIGPRNTGKSVLLKDLLYHTKSHYDLAMAMTATISTVDMLKEFIPHRLIFTNGYDFAFGDKFLITTRNTIAQRKLRHSVLVLDDCMFDNRVMKSEAQKNLHMNGRHYKTSIFNTTQYCMVIPNDIRTDIDYILALRENTMANKRRLFEYFFGMFKNFSEFDRVFSHCTKNFGALVLDKTRPSSCIEDCMRWYVASPIIPEFKLGKEVYFQLTSLVDEMDVMSKKKKAASSLQTKIIQ
jgi:hypothetical protein